MKFALARCSASIDPAESSVESSEATTDRSVALLRRRLSVRSARRPSTGCLSIRLLLLLSISSRSSLATCHVADRGSGGLFGRRQHVQISLDTVVCTQPSEREGLTTHLNCC